MTHQDASLQDEPIQFLDEDCNPGERQEAETVAGWPVLIVDDEQSVHYATSYALSNTIVEGRPLDFLHAYSAKEAQECLSNRSDVAVMLLDVVMEHENSGLELVRLLRTEMNMHTLRIILRTGQSGYAPEAQVIRDYDINDYKLKSELTQTTLVTALTSAIRSYEQIRSLMVSRRGLAQIVESANELLATHSLAAFAEGVLMRLYRLIDSPPEAALFCAQTFSAEQPDAADRGIRVVDATGSYASWIGRAVDEVDDHEALAAIRQCLERKADVVGHNAVTLFVSDDPERSAVIHFTSPKALSTIERQLLDVFCVNVAVGLKNICLFDDLHFLAFSDPLTGLLNRKGFIDAIDRHPSKLGSEWTVALIDFDHFAEINDALGHSMGDALLVGIARRLRAHWVEDCLLARVGGDVFGLFAPDASLAPECLAEVFLEPLAVEGYRVPISVTAGLTRLSEENGSGMYLFRTTSTALKHAKTDTRGQCHYHTREMTEKAKERMVLLNQLRHAVTTKQGMQLCYQPQVDLNSGRLVGVEALLRWRNEDGQNIPPDRFIALAENTGLMLELGEWIFRTGVLQLRQFDAMGMPPMRMAINLSLVQFRAPEFAERLIRIVDELQVPPNRLELEITESIAMLDIDKVIHSLSAFKAAGMEVAVDDFGTGFSSLAYLHRLPVNRLKIDKSFVQSMSSAGNSGNTIANLVINLGHSLDLSVIAEGIESEEQASLLRDMGCDLGQGFLFARALPPEALPDWLRRRSSGQAG